MAGLWSLGRRATEPQHLRKWQNIPPRELIRQRHFPNLQLITQHGKKVQFYDDLIKDRKVIINFMFTSCANACPLVTANLVRVQRILHDRIGHGIHMYSITLDPEVDTPDRLRQYAAMHGVGAGWLFLTGKAADIELLRRSLGFVQRNPRERCQQNQPYRRNQVRDGGMHAMGSLSRIGPRRLGCNVHPV